MMLEVAASEHVNFLANQMTWRFVQRVDGRPASPRGQDDTANWAGRQYGVGVPQGTAPTNPAQSQSPTNVAQGAGTPASPQNPPSST
jgi:hypothetical protein